MAVLGITAVEEIYRLLLRGPASNSARFTFCRGRHRSCWTRRCRSTENCTSFARMAAGLAALPDVVVNRLAQQRLEELYHTIRTLSDLETHRGFPDARRSGERGRIPNTPRWSG